MALRIATTRDAGWLTLYWHTGRQMHWLLVVLLALVLGCSTVTVSPTQTPTQTPTSTAPPTPSPIPTLAMATPSAVPTPAPTPLMTPVPTMPSTAEIEAALTAPGVLTACMSVVGAPATDLSEDGLLVGYNVDIAAEIAERLGLDLATQEPLFDALIDRVRDHECDMSVSSQNITAGRLTLVDFVAYSESLQPVLVQINNPHNINALTDLCGQPVSATEGTTHIDLVNGTGDYVAQGLNEGCAAAGRSLIDLQIHETESHAVTALLQGNVTAYLGNPSFAFEFPTQVEYSDATLPPARQGITTAVDRPALHAAVAATLAEMMADGTYRGILVQHLPNDASVRIVSILE